MEFTIFFPVCETTFPGVQLLTIAFQYIDLGISPKTR